MNPGQRLTRVGGVYRVADALLVIHEDHLSAHLSCYFRPVSDYYASHSFQKASKVTSACSCLADGYALREALSNPLQGAPVPTFSLAHEPLDVPLILSPRATFTNTWKIAIKIPPSFSKRSPGYSRLISLPRCPYPVANHLFGNTFNVSLFHVSNVFAFLAHFFEKTYRVVNWYWIE